MTQAKTCARPVRTLISSVCLAIGTLVVAAPAFAEGERVVHIHHDDDGELFFNVVKNGASLAAEQVGVQIEFRNPAQGDMAEMARIVEQVTASRPDAILVTIGNYEILEAPIRDAIAQGIPVITYNTGTEDESEKLGALTHVGQPEYLAGKMAGERAKKEGVQDFVCVNDYIASPASIERCQGFADGLGVDLSGRMIDSGTDIREIGSKVEAYLRANPDVDGILSLSATSASGTLVGLGTMSKDDIYFGTFDLSEEIIDNVESGVIDFAIDQQPFLQGYLPVVLIANYLRYGLLPSTPIATGPNFVTQENAALVKELAGDVR